MTHIVFYSGGLASFAAAHRVAERFGTDNLILLFTDTKAEDCDLYRFLRQGAAYIGGKLIEIADGRTPWQVFRDKRFIGNNRTPVCSRVLKQETARKWIKANHPDPAAVTLYLGLGSEEMHRLPAPVAHWKPYTVEYPLLWRPWLVCVDWAALATKAGLEPPRLYAAGFPHANCGGACVRAGIAQWRHLLTVNHQRYAAEEAEEESLRLVLGKDVSILKRRGKPLRLRVLREQTQRQLPLLEGEEFDWGGCGCFVDDDGRGAA